MSCTLGTLHTFTLKIIIICADISIQAAITNTDQYVFCSLHSQLQSGRGLGRVWFHLRSILSVHFQHNAYVCSLRRVRLTKTYVKKARHQEVREVCFFHVRHVRVSGHLFTFFMERGVSWNVVSGV